jgi:histone deacetylase complex regulatory component SIN3
MNSLPSFEEAMVFLKSVKQAIAREQYKHFLSLLLAYKNNNVEMERVLNIAKRLLACSPTLVKQFLFFLPDQVRDAPRYTHVAEPFAFPLGTGMASLALPSKTGQAELLADHVRCFTLFI